MHKILPVKLDEVVMPDETNKLIENVEELDKRVLSNDEDILSNKESITSLTSVVASNKEALESEVLLLDEKINQSNEYLNTKIDTDITGLDKKIDKNISDILVNKESIETLSEVVDTNKSDADSSIESLDNRVFNLELAGGGEDMKAYLEANYYDKKIIDAEFMNLSENTTKSLEALNSKIDTQLPIGSQLFIRYTGVNGDIIDPATPMPTYGTWEVISKAGFLRFKSANANEGRNASGVQAGADRKLIGSIQTNSTYTGIGQFINSNGVLSHEKQTSDIYLIQTAGKTTRDEGNVVRFDNSQVIPTSNTEVRVHNEGVYQIIKRIA